MPASPIICGVFELHPQERVVFGKTAVEAVLQELDRLGAQRVFVTTTSSLAAMANGPLQNLLAALGRRLAGVFHGISAHSLQSGVIAGATAARDSGADVLLALGGGSVIDATKAMLLCLWEDLRDSDELDVYHAATEGLVRQSVNVTHRMLSVSTTLSAADFTARAGITHDESRTKRSFAHPMMVPRVAVLDPAATIATPLILLAATGLRAVDHAVESWCSPYANPATEPLSLQGFRLLLEALPDMVAAPEDMRARQQAQFGMWQAIAAATSGAGTGASHGIGYALGARHGVAHGVTSCILLSAVLQWNSVVNSQRQQALVAAAGMKDIPLWQLVGELVVRLGLPQRMRDLGIAKAELNELAAQALRYAPVRRNPRPISGSDDIRQILELAW